MEVSNSLGSEAEGSQQQQQPQQETGTEGQQRQQPDQQRQGKAEVKKGQEQDEGDTQEVISEWLRLRQCATRPRVLAAIDQQLRILGCDVSTLTPNHQVPQQQQKRNDQEEGEGQHAQQEKGQQDAKDTSSRPGSSLPNAGLQPVYQQPIKLSSGSSAGGAGPSVPFLPLTSFAWDQTADAIKLYVKVPGVQQLPQENIRMRAAPRSIELELVGVENKNYSFAQKTLSNPINPSNCSYRVKRDMVVVTLRKASPTWWAELSQKRESKLSTPKFNENADPGASIMAMMKNLYEEGDDEMKRMIAKSWTQSQEEKLGRERSPFADINF